MDYQRLGKSDLHISRIGFGCMSLKPGAAENETVVQQAIEAGINFFDTADLYDKGANEEFLGKALKEKRKEVILASKAGNQWKADGSGWTWNPRKDYILACAEKSLQRLQTDCIDLYQLHGGTLDDPIDETIEAFEQLKQEGKIRYYGISSIRPNVIREWVKRSNIVSVMTQYSLLDRRPEEETLGLLQEKNIGVLARGGLAQGLLVDKPAKPYLNHSGEEVEEAAKALANLSTEERRAVQTALQFVLRHPAITSAVVGMRTSAQLKEAVAAVGAMLSDEELRRLQDAVLPNFYSNHR
ncbi:aldo/keto reductase [Flavisolibacter ginsenosidimutans]|uniref:Aldo/keto reductase n=1 Tax=Flavisolibacter ginsenosidimutans TaxID=661481 RepID=A0A5B8UI41_9BACT|nr:aldo/keto reductase [Flavisolibacter ginsenosidimutans]QEC56331.1 aldo/keto reductase [Flavisolibacter ginsenosidimutans]